MALLQLFQPLVDPRKSRLARVETLPLCRHDVRRRLGCEIAAQLAFEVVDQLLSLLPLLYQVGALDPVAFSTAPVLLGAATLLATWLPARRATRISPMMALRTE